MKKAIVFLSAILLCICAFAQNNLGKTDDSGRIILTPILVDNVSIPDYAASAVITKLNQAVTQYGLAGTSFDQRFVITANFIELLKEATPSAPPMIAIDIQPSLFIGDLSTGALFASVTLPPVKGVGNNETKAYMAAVKALKFNNPAFGRFIEEGKTKIIEYYNSQIDFILSEADALCSQENYDGAIALLMTVPEVCKVAFEKAMDKTVVVYQKKIDKEGLMLLNAARQAWNANQSWAGAEIAGDYLAQINPNCSSYAAASTLSNEIAKRIRVIDKREWDFKMKQHNDKVKLESEAIKASKEIGIAQAKRPIIYNTKVHWW